MRNKLLAATAACALAIAARPAMATIIIENSSSGCGGCSTVHLVDDVTGDDFVIGWVSSSNIDVLFSSDEVLAVTGGQGQAWVGGADGTTEDLTFQVLGHTFDAAEFNLNTASNHIPAWGVTITGYDQNHHAYSQDFTFTQHPGQNEFFDLTILAGSGEHISSIAFRIDGTDSTPPTTSGIVASGQWRVGGISVPEPATWSMMILGFGGLGAMMRRRRALRIAA